MLHPVYVRFILIDRSRIDSSWFCLLIARYTPVLLRTAPLVHKLLNGGPKKLPNLAGKTPGQHYPGLTIYAPLQGKRAGWGTDLFDRVDKWGAGWGVGWGRSSIRIPQKATNTQAGSGETNHSTFTFSLKPWTTNQKPRVMNQKPLTSEPLDESNRTERRSYSMAERITYPSSLERITYPYPRKGARLTTVRHTIRYGDEWSC